MWKLLPVWRTKHLPENYIIATGQSHPQTELVATEFEWIGKDWRDCVVADEHLMRPTDIRRNRVNPSKAAREPGCKAKSGHEGRNPHNAGSGGGVRRLGMCRPMSRAR
jgi:hypothetical protein